MIVSRKYVEHLESERTRLLEENRALINQIMLMQNLPKLGEAPKPVEPELPTGFLARRKFVEAQQSRGVR